jgi:transposase-like protein
VTPEEKQQARQATSSAIRSGRLVRQPCEMGCSERAEAHHEDYAKPLEIRWLCRACHRVRHKEMGGTGLRRAVRRELVLTPAESAAWREISEREGVSVSELVRTAMLADLGRTVLEVARRHLAERRPKAARSHSERKEPTT